MVYDCWWTRVFELKWLFFLDLSMVDRRLHDDLRDFYMHLKAPCLDRRRQPRHAQLKRDTTRNRVRNLLRALNTTRGAQQGARTLHRRRRRQGRNKAGAWTPTEVSRLEVKRLEV